MVSKLGECRKIVMQQFMIAGETEHNKKTGTMVRKIAEKDPASLVHMGIATKTNTLDEMWVYLGNLANTKPKISKKVTKHTERLNNEYIQVQKRNHYAHLPAAQLP